MNASSNKYVLTSEMRGVALGLRDLLQTLADVISTDDPVLTAVDQAVIREGVMDGVCPLLDRYNILFRQFSESV